MILKELISRNRKILYVFENYPETYKEFVKNFDLYIESVDEIFDGQFAVIRVNLKTMIQKELGHEDLKCLVMDQKRIIEEGLHAL